MPIKSFFFKQNDKIDVDKYVYQGSPYNAYQNQKSKSKSILKSKSKRFTFIRGPSYNAYINRRKKYEIKKKIKKNVKIDPQKYVHQGPPIMPIKKTK